MAILMVLSVLFVAVLFAWEGHKEFNLWDEGFLWYGAQRVLAGEVPIRDFSAYDPARYYWVAAIMKLVGNSAIVGSRIAAAVCEVLALFFALKLISQSKKAISFENIAYMALASVVLVSWMYVYYKVYDIAASILLIAAFSFFLENPTALRHFLLGICIGFVATIGRNHGVYAMVACVGVVATARFRANSSIHWFDCVPALLAGVIVGFLPVLVMLLVVDGFAAAFMQSIYYLFEMKATNLPLPVPWPWRMDLLALPAGPAVHGFLAGLCFIALLAFPLLSITWMVFKKIKGKPIDSTFAAAAWLSLPYAHYAYSRADVPHLSFGIFPMLIGSLIVLQGVKPTVRWSLLSAVFLVSVMLMFPLHPAGKCLVVYRCVDVDVAGDIIRMPEKKASEIGVLKQLVAQYVPAGGSFLATPSWPGAYALFNMRSPVFDIYSITKRSDSFQKKEIERLVAAQPDLVIVVDDQLDGSDGHLLKNTNPLVFEFILGNFLEVPVHGSKTVRAYRSRQRMGGASQLTAQ